MIHAPELSKRNHELLTAVLGLGYSDSSYKNDTCDSLYNEELDIAIYLPNAEVADEDDVESFDTFSVVINQEEVDGEAIYSGMFDTISDVASYIIRMGRLRG